jgi:hypothetical protein
MLLLNPKNFGDAAGLSTCTHSAVDNREVHGVYDTLPVRVSASVMTFAKFRGEICGVPIRKKLGGHSQDFGDIFGAIPAAASR